MQTAGFVYVRMVARDAKKDKGASCCRKTGCTSGHAAASASHLQNEDGLERGLDGLPGVRLVEQTEQRVSKLEHDLLALELLQSGPRKST